MENLKSYLDGELDIAQQAEVETHLRNDAELQKMVEEFSAISSTLKTADSGEPYGFEKLEERLKETPKTSIYEKKKIWRLATYWSASMACVALAAMMVRSGSGSSADASAGMVATSRGMSDLTASSKVGQSDLAAGKEQDKSQPMREEFSKSVDGVDSMNPASSAGSGGVPKGAAGVSAGESEASEPAAQDNRGGIRTQDSGIDNDSATPAKKGVMTGTPSGESASKPESEPKMDVFGGSTVLQNGPTRGKSQWYDQSGKLKEESGRGNSAKMPSAESAFKQGMRDKRDRVTQAIPGVPETDHGIFLERKGEMQVKVEDLKRAVNETTGMIASLDGFVTSSTTQNQADSGEAIMTLRVPTKNFATAIDKLGAMGELISENTGSLDITTETVNNSARMISWADEEKRLMDELAKTKNTNERYRLKGLIGQARANLEAHKAQVNSLLERAKYSTINLSLVRGDKAVKSGGSGNWSGDALKGAKDNLGSIGQVLGTLGIYFLVFSPIWLPFAIAAYYIKKKNS